MSALLDVGALRARSASLWFAGAALVGAAAIGLTSVRNPVYCLFGVLALGLVVLALANLTLGIAALTLLAFLEHLPGVPTGLTITKPLGVVIVLSWLVALTRNSDRVPLLTRDRPVLSYLLVGLVGWGAASATWATDVGAALGGAGRLAMVVIFFFVVYSAIRNRRDFLTIVWAFLVGAFAVSATALVTDKTIAGRLTGGMLDPNFLAAALASSIVVAGFLLLVTGRAGRFVLLAFIGTYFVALVLTQSRGGLIATAAALIATCIVAGPVRARAVALVVVVSAVGLVYYTIAAPSSLRDRVTDISVRGSAGRTDTWQIALRMTADHPVRGVGLGNFRATESRYVSGTINLVNARGVLNERRVTHNTYLQVLSELGFVGLGLLLTVLAVTLAVAWQGVRTMSGAALRSGLVARGLVAGTVGLLVAYVFLSGEYEKQLWLLLGLLASTPSVARDALAASAAARPS